MTNNITLPRATVQQALEALENSSPDQYPEDAGVFYDAITALRTALEQQQAEPVAWMDREGDLYKMPEIKNWAPPHTMLYTAPQQREWDKPSTSFNDWWNGDYDDSANPFEQDSAAYWAWAGWQAAHRQWVGLTDEDVRQCSRDVVAGGSENSVDRFAYAIEAKLKEKNV